MRLLDIIFVFIIFLSVPAVAEEVAHDEPPTQTREQINLDEAPSKTEDERTAIYLKNLREDRIQLEKIDGDAPLYPGAENASAGAREGRQ